MRGPDKRTTERARRLRHTDNEVEGILWAELRDRRLNGLKFVRQWAIGRYFADFACREVKLVVEADGHQHAGSTYDRARDRYIHKQGWSIVRFWNTSILTDRRSVLETIVAIADGRMNAAVSSSELIFIPAGTGDHEDVHPVSD